MGLFGSTLRWECNNCGRVHKSNPEKCSNCSHTVFSPNRKEGLLSFGGGRKKRRRKSKSSHYRCTKCGHVHDRKPFVCDECGASTLAPYDPPPKVEVAAPHDQSEQPPATDSPSIVPVLIGLLLMAVVVVVFVVVFL